MAIDTAISETDFSHSQSELELQRQFALGDRVDLMLGTEEFRNFTQNMENYRYRRDRRDITQLHVRAIPSPQEILPLLKQWLTEDRLLSPSGSEEIALVKDHQEVLLLLIDKIEFSRSECLLAVCDHMGNIEGLVYFIPASPSVSKVSCLCTAPKNLRLKANSAPLHGVGAALVAAVVRTNLIIQKTGSMELESMVTAKSFYQRLGFEERPGDLIFTLEEDASLSLLNKYGKLVAQPPSLLDDEAFCNSYLFSRANQGEIRQI